MDDMDWAIARELQQDARLSFSELSRRVHLSPPAVAERVRRMEDAGVITGYHAHVESSKVGWGVPSFIRMSCFGSRCLLNDPQVLEWPGVREIHRITGDECCILKIEASSIQELQVLLDRLSSYGRPASTMVLATYLDWHPVTPVRPLDG